MTSKECVEVVVAQFHTESEHVSRKAEKKLSKADESGLTV